MSARRRTPLAPQSLTSLVDVLFILVFAALVQRAAAAQAPAAAAPPAPPASPSPAAAPRWTPPPELTELRRAAEAKLAQELRERPVVIARVSARGVLTSLEVAAGSTGALDALLSPAPGSAAAPGGGTAPSARIALDLPLMEKVPDPDVSVGYVADREPARRICAVAAARLGSLQRSLVILAVDAPLAELMVALVAGLRRDVEDCLTEHRAAAVLLDSGALSPTPAPAAPARGPHAD